MTNGPVTSPNRDESSPGPDVREIEIFCRQMIRAMHLELKAIAIEDPSAVRINLTGPDRPLLLSGGAQVLNSMEYLVNRGFRAGKGENAVSILLDSDNYRQHREAELVLLAQMASQKVMAQRKPLSLQPMTPRERRIVHLALAAIAGVRSESEGEGDHRSITIFPT